MNARAAAARTASSTREAAVSPSTAAWHPARRIGFRFLFSYRARTLFGLPPKNGAIELEVDGRKTPLAFATPDPTHVVLRGRYNGDEITVTLKKVPDARMLLLNRGFHWLNETPFIR